MIEIAGLCREYDGKDALKDIQLNIEKGVFTAIVGSNGSGKSTLARHLNAILLPQRGSVIIDGISAKETERVYDIRKKVGIVFQNPDSQSVASIVEEDTAFAPENLGLSDSEIQRRIDFALEAAGISQLRFRSISTLSGGEKQLVSIAGILAMRPDYMVFDEATSMLDPKARARIIECVRILKKELGIGIIWITHYMDEAAEADKVIVLSGGKVAAAGGADEIFNNVPLLECAGLSMPLRTRLNHILSGEDIGEAQGDGSVMFGSNPTEPSPCVLPPKIIEIKNVSYSYPAPDKKIAALRDVSAKIHSGMLTAIIGKTGSGKSTLLEVLAGLSKPDSGEVRIYGKPINEMKKHIGIVFQQSESQLFADTVYDDIAYGAINLRLSGEELKERVFSAAKTVGLSRDCLNLPPFSLSGGEKRLAAIAGVLAMRPGVLLLDEPAAGLDPSGKRHIFSILKSLIAAEPNMTIVFVTHSMDDAAEYADYVIALSGGKTAACSGAREVLLNESLLKACGLDMPEVSRLCRQRGIDGVLTLGEARRAVAMGKGGGYAW